MKFNNKLIIHTTFLGAMTGVLIGCSGGSTGSQKILNGVISESNTSSLVQVGAKVDLTYTLDGAQNVPNITIKANPSDKSVFNESYSCVIEKGKNSCTITAIALKETLSGVTFTSNAESYSIPISDVVNVLPPHSKIMFVSESSPSGDMFSHITPYSTKAKGIDRADMICQLNASNSDYLPNGIAHMSRNGQIKWKALLVDTANRYYNSYSQVWVDAPLIANTTYYDIKSQKRIGTTLQDNAIFDLNNTQHETIEHGPGYGGSYKYASDLVKIYLWIGLDNSSWLSPGSSANSCNDWNTSNMNMPQVYAGTPWDYSYTRDPITGIIHPFERERNERSIVPIMGEKIPCNAQDVPSTYDLRFESYVGIAVRLLCVEQ